MRTFIEVKTQFDALHKYEKAPEEVAFLKYPHRHMFYVTLKIEVFYLDRELEFFMVQKELGKVIDKYIKKNGMDSCEMMAEHIIRKFEKKNPENILLMYDKRSCQVTVSEDNENAGVIDNFDEVRI